MFELLEDRLVPAGGPVIIGGDDLTQHGSITGTTLNQGWQYIRKTLESVAPKVTRISDKSVVVLGSADATATSGDAGAAYHFAVPQAAAAFPASLANVISFRDGATAINQFFTELAAGTAKPAIIVTAGTDAANDLDAAEGAALTSNAAAIAAFVSSGGGLIGHGGDATTVAYGWLSTLLPGLTVTNIQVGGSSNVLALTAAGTAAFPGLTAGDINAGPWHDYFSPQSALGGLSVLATDTQGNDAQGLPHAVIIGGAQAIIGPPGPTPDTGFNLAKSIFFPKRPNFSRPNPTVVAWISITNKDVDINKDLTITFNVPGVTMRVITATKALKATGTNAAGKTFLTITGGLKRNAQISIYVEFTYSAAMSLDGIRKLISIASTVPTT